MNEPSSPIGWFVEELLEKSSAKREPFKFQWIAAMTWLYLYKLKQEEEKGDLVMLGKEVEIWNELNRDTMVGNRIFASPSLYKTIRMVPRINFDEGTTFFSLMEGVHEHVTAPEYIARKLMIQKIVSATEILRSNEQIAVAIHKRFGYMIKENL